MKFVFSTNIFQCLCISSQMSQLETQAKLKHKNAELIQHTILKM